MGSKMFDHYPQPDDYIPHNKPSICREREVKIMAGETTVHSFEVPFRIDDTVIDFKAIYKLGLNVILTKPKGECTDIVYDECRCLSIITWTLSADETNLFRDTLMDAKVQLEFNMSDGSTLYTDIIKIKLQDSLGDMYTPVPPVVTTGFGWTED